jgi:hypothetical protein
MKGEHAGQDPVLLEGSILVLVVNTHPCFDVVL